MSRDVKTLNQWFVSVNSSVKGKLWLFVPSEQMLCVFSCLLLRGPQIYYGHCTILYSFKMLTFPRKIGFFTLCSLTCIAGLGISYTEHIEALFVVCVVVQGIYSLAPMKFFEGVFSCVITISNILFWLTLSIILFCSSISSLGCLYQ